MVYLDHAATSPLRPSAAAAMQTALTQVGNPSSVHQAGQQARFQLDTARRQIAGLLSVRPEQLIFTSSGSEANNLALRGVMQANPEKRLLVSAVEHPCVLETAKSLQQRGVKVTFLPVDQHGLVAIETLQTELAKGDVALVSIMAANNETGVRQDLAGLYEACRAAGVLFHTDAVQLLGHAELSDFKADLITISAHKIGGPLGAAALIVPGKIEMHAQITGGAQERNRRAGTENLPAIVGFGAACEELSNELAAELAKYQALGQQLAQELAQQSSQTQIIAAEVERVPHVQQLLTVGLNSEEALMALDLAGIAVSQGSACSSGRSEPSHVLQAMGYSAAEANCALRVSFGWNTTAEDVSAFVKAYAELSRKLLAA